MGAFPKLPLLGNRFQILRVYKPGFCPATLSRAQVKGGVLPPRSPFPSDKEGPAQPREDWKGVDPARWVPSKRLF